MVVAKKRGLYKILAYLAIFSFVGIFIAPAINEAMIALALHMFSCPYAQTPSADIVRGFQIEINPLCNLNPGQEIILFGIGPATNAIISFGFFLGNVLAKRRKNQKAFFLTSILFAGFLTSPIFLMLSGEGELYELFTLLGEPSLWLLPVLGSILLAVLVIYFWSQSRQFV